MHALRPNDANTEVRVNNYTPCKNRPGEAINNNHCASKSAMANGPWQRPHVSMMQCIERVNCGHSGHLQVASRSTVVRGHDTTARQQRRRPTGISSASITHTARCPGVTASAHLGARRRRPDWDDLVTRALTAVGCSLRTV